MAARVRSAPSLTTPLWVLAVFAALFFLKSAKSLLIPIALAVLLSYALEPAVAALERRRLPRWAGAALLLVVLFGVCAGGAYILRDDARDIAEMLPKAVEQARDIVASQLGSTESLEPTANGVPPGTRSEARGPEPAGSEAERAIGTSGMITGDLVRQFAAAVIALAGNLVVIVFLVFFMLLSGHRIRNRIVEISGHDPDSRRTTATIIGDINTQIQRYLLVLLITAVVVGMATWGMLAWMGVERAPVWGVLAGVFNSIPYFGPVIVSGGLFVVGMVQEGNVTQALQMSGAALVITSIEGWLVTPALMGKAERMSALAVFLGLLLWTWVWGEWGTLLAVPMLVVIKSVADHVERLKPIGRLMAP
jgi:predicted PurR-regulated permease PerM